MSAGWVHKFPMPATNTSPTTSHSRNVCRQPEFVVAPEVAQRSVLMNQSKALTKSTADMAKALERLEILGESHPAVLTLRAAIALIHEEIDALEHAAANL